MAARLGYETSATDLGLAVTDGGARYDRPVVAVGQGNPLLPRGGLDPAALAGELAPGQGALVPLRPGDAAPFGGVAVVGFHATGTLAAASYLSAPYPSVWALDGRSWRALRDTVGAFLGSRGLAVADVRLDRIVVEQGRPGVTRARVTVSLADAPAVEVARAALEGRDTLPMARDGTPPTRPRGRRRWKG